MTFERWQAIKRVLAAWEEAPPKLRPEVLLQACGSDEALRRDVQSLLAYQSQAEALDHAAAPIQISLERIGKQFSHYRILDVLGGGGMGLVYRAEDLRLGRQAALKFLPDVRSNDPVALQRFQREARAASALNHPNICTIYEIEEQDGQPFIVMELLEGRTLREMIAAPLAIGAILDLGQQIAAGLDAAHRHGIIHRDIKPANIFITQQGQAKILDFGLAKMHGQPGADEASPQEIPKAGADLSLSVAGAAMGTVGYMSPEQMRGETLDARSDLYSFGLVLYEMATGKAASITGPRPTLAPKLAPIIDKALQPERAQRYQSAAEMRTDLQEAAAHRSRRWMAAVAMVVVACVGLALWLWAGASKPPRVTHVMQLTHLAHAGPHLAADDQKVYFTEEEPRRYKLVQVSRDGGEPVEVPAPFRNGRVLDISPDQTELLVDGWDSDGGTERAIWRLPLHAGSPRMVTSLASEQARWSRDGSRIVFNHDGLWSIQTDGSGLQKIADSAGIDDWSPDGRLIRFTRVNGAKGGSSFWEIQADGTHLRPFLPGRQSPNARWGEGIGQGKWTPDGSYFFFHEAFDQKTSLWAIRETAGMWRWSQPQPVQIYAAGFSISAWAPPALGPDGRRMYVVAESQIREMVRYDRTEGRFVPLLPGVSGESRGYSPDGLWLAYTTYPGSSLWRSKPDGSQRTQLTFPPMQVFGTVWSPDGKRLAFQILMPGKSTKICLLPAEGGKPQLLFENEPTGENSPNFSADGNQLAFSRSYLTADGNTRSIAHCVLDLRTGRVSTLPETREGIWTPFWSPDGRYMASQSGARDIVLFDPASSTWKTLVSGTHVYWPRWSSDSRYIYWQDRTPAGDQLYRVRAPGGQKEQVPSWDAIRRGVPSTHWFAGLTPDGQPLANVVRRYADIYALDLDLP